MAVALETNWRRQLDAGCEAVELLSRAGFNVHDIAIQEEASDSTFEVTVELSVDELTRPLEALEE
jgi:hypothetical protein